jgi:hypothetical protein
MKRVTSHPSIDAGELTTAQGVSRRHLRSIHPPAPSQGSDEHAQELLTQTTDAADPGNRPLSVLTW